MLWKEKFTQIDKSIEENNKLANDFINKQVDINSNFLNDITEIDGAVINNKKEVEEKISKVVEDLNKVLKDFSVSNGKQHEIIGYSIKKIDKRLDTETTAIGEDIFSLISRVGLLEKKVQALIDTHHNNGMISTALNR